MEKRPYNWTGFFAEQSLGEAGASETRAVPKLELGNEALCCGKVSRFSTCSRRPVGGDGLRDAPSHASHSEAATEDAHAGNFETRKSPSPFEV
jgi:hypothetical protein